MEGDEDEDNDFGSFPKATEVPPLQAAEPTDPLGQNARDFDRHSLSPLKPIALEGGGKAKPRAGKQVG